MDRREFLVVLGSVTVAVAIADTTRAEDVVAGTVLDAGPLDSFEQEKVYDQFRDQGVLLIRRGDDMFALSPICTHKGCKVRPQDDQSFLCKCHKSHFDSEGKVLNGPAKTDLLRLKIKVSPDRHVLVKVEKPQTTG